MSKRKARGREPRPRGNFEVSAGDLQSRFEELILIYLGGQYRNERPDVPVYIVADAGVSDGALELCLRDRSRFYIRVRVQRKRDLTEKEVQEWEDFK